MAIYHLHMSTGSRAKQKSASAKAAYICRKGKYKSDSTEVLGFAQGNMPGWVPKNDVLRYWKEADKFERANAKLYREIEFALPAELSFSQQVELTKQFVAALTRGDYKLPFTMAMHRGHEDDNPHVHLLISERANDGIKRDSAQWFRRANKKEPAKGGAAKVDLGAPSYLQMVRRKWQDLANAALLDAGIDATIDHQSHKDRGFIVEPGEHKGAYLTKLERELAQINQEITDLKKTIPVPTIDQDIYQPLRPRF